MYPDEYNTYMMNFCSISLSQFGVGVVSKIFELNSSV